MPRWPRSGAQRRTAAGEWFVIEADESDGSFLAGPRAAALITNVEPDHLEFWGGWDQLREGFRRFLVETDGPAGGLRGRPGGGGDRTRGRRGRVRLRARGRLPDRGPGAQLVGFAVRARAPRRPASRWSCPRRGCTTRSTPRARSRSRASWASTWSLRPRGSPASPARRVASSGGAASAGVEFVDDYAHLPTEVRAALAAGRSGGWSRVVAVFQPHRYSRTEALWEEFATAFDDADLLVLTEIYAGGRGAAARA